jgi:hypothetical protein
VRVSLLASPSSGAHCGAKFSAIAIAVAFISVGPLYAQGTSHPSFTRAVSAVSTLLANEFPEWGARPTGLSIEVTSGTDAGVAGLRLSVLDGRPEERVSSRWATVIRFLEGGVDFGRSGRVVGVLWRGRAVHSAELYRLIEIVDANQSWPDSQIATLLRDRGAKFGPDDKAALLSRIRRGALDRVFGPFRIRGVRFVFRDPRLKGVAETTAILEWDVSVETKTAQETLHFEPFEGRLVMAEGVEYSELPQGVRAQALRLQEWSEQTDAAHPTAASTTQQLREAWPTADPPRFGPRDRDSMLLYLHRARGLQDLQAPPGNRLEALKGDRRGQYSIRINDRWRICFTRRDGDAYDVEIVDYH